LPQFFQLELVPQGIHRLPEAAVRVGRQLLVVRQALQRLALPDRRVALDVAERAGFEDEESTVDPGAIARRFFLETRDADAR